MQGRTNSDIVSRQNPFNVSVDVQYALVSDSDQYRCTADTGVSSIVIRLNVTGNTHVLRYIINPLAFQPLWLLAIPIDRLPSGVVQREGRGGRGPQ